MLFLLNIAGGVALILFGTRFLRKGLDRLFGQSLVRWLQSLTQHPLKAFIAGIVTGVVTPSSTAVSMVAVQMLSAGQLSAERMLAVFLGTNVGITAPAQLLAFRIQDYAPLFLLAGVLGFQFMKRNSLRGIGQCLLALGFMFQAMQLISTATKAIEPQGDLGILLHLIASHTWAVVTISSVLALVLQSSTAAMGFGIGLATTGLFSAEAMMAWVLGANIGIAFTTLMAGWNNLEARRMACANLAVKGIAAAAILACLPLLKISTPESKTLLASQTVHFHTLFNLGVGMISLPFVPLISRLMRAMIEPAPVTALTGPTTHLDVNALDSPSLALANATREVLRIADEVKLMLQSFWQAQMERDRALAARVHAHDDEVDDTAAAVTEYLSRISQESLSGQDTHWQFTLLSCANELESIGDIIDKNLCDFVRKQAGHGFPMTAEDEGILGEAYEQIRYRCDVTFSLLTTRDATIATQIIRSEELLEEWFRQEQRAHYERLRFGGDRVLQSSVYFLDMLGAFRRISSHLTSIAYSFVAVDFESEADEGVPATVPAPQPTGGAGVPQTFNVRQRAI